MTITRSKNNIKKILIFIEVILKVDIINLVNFPDEISKYLFFSLNKFNLKKITKVENIILFVENIILFELMSLII